MPTKSPATVRSDVRRNRRVLIDAARELFATETDIPMYKIAEHAGVGQATLYRHFPDRSRLAAAVAEELLDELELAAAAEPRPTLESLLTEFVGYVGGLGRLRAMIAEGEAAPSLQQTRSRMARLFDRPLREAKAAGRVSAEITRNDVVLLMAMIEGGLSNATETQAQRMKLADRALKLALAALRPR